MGYRLRKLVKRNKRAVATLVLLSVVVLCTVTVIAGSIGWAIRDRQTRQAVIERQILLALDDVKANYDQGKLSDATAAVKEAKGLLASSETQPAIKQRVQQWKADLDTVRRLEEIQWEKATITSEEQRSNRSTRRCRRLHDGISRLRS